MAAGVLIGVMILTLWVYLFLSFGAQSEDIYNKMEEQQLVEYNAQYTLYSGRNDVTIYDIISVANLAYENNKKYDISAATVRISVPQMKKNNRYHCNQDSVKTFGQISYSHRFSAKYDDKINSTSAHLQI